jgi:hypothetical protein
MSKDVIQMMISLGAELDEQQNNAHDLWTWLPSYKETQKHHDDYVDNFTPAVKDIIQEASLYLHYLTKVPAPVSDDVVDKIIFQIGNTHDQSELWGHLRKDPEVFRQAVRLALGTKPPEYTTEERDWFTKCACGEDHIPE